MNYVKEMHFVHYTKLLASVENSEKSLFFLSPPSPFNCFLETNKLYLRFGASCPEVLVLHLSFNIAGIILDLGWKSG